MRGRSTIYCHFCGKHTDDVLVMIAGPTACICNECVDLAGEIILERRALSANPAAIYQGSPPPTLGDAGS